MRFRRRLTLQLTALLDMMLIVIFAQYMEVRQSAERQARQASEAVAQRQAAVLAQKADQQVAEQAVQKAEELRQRNAKLQAALEQQRVELSAAVRESRAERDRIAALAAELLRTSEEALKRVFADSSAEEFDRIRQTIATMPATDAESAARQMLAIDALRRASEIWQIHIDDNSVIRVSNGRDSTSFRADTAAEFEQKLFEWYKTLPPTKSVVVMLVSWADATLRAREAVRSGIVMASKRLHADDNGKTIFEYSIAGFKPRPPDETLEK